MYMFTCSEPINRLVKSKNVKFSQFILNKYIYIYFSCTATLVGFQFPDQGSNLCSLSWKHSLNHWTTRIVQKYDFCRKYGVKVPGNFVNATICNKLSNELIESGNWDMGEKTNTFHFQMEKRRYTQRKSQWQACDQQLTAHGSSPECNTMDKKVS